MAVAAAQVSVQDRGGPGVYCFRLDAKMEVLTQQLRG